MKSANFIARLITCTLWFSLAVAVCAQERLVEDLEIKGYRSVSIEELRKLIKTKPGAKLNAEHVKQDFNALLATGHFDNLKSKVMIDDGPRGGAVVIFDLKELPERK